MCNCDCILKAVSVLTTFLNQNLNNIDIANTIQITDEICLVGNLKSPP